MSTKTFPPKAAMAWLPTLQLAPADTLELRQHIEDLERYSLRVAKLDAAIAQFSAVALSSRIAGIERFSVPCLTTLNWES